MGMSRKRIKTKATNIAEICGAITFKTLYKLLVVTFKVKGSINSFLNY